MSPLRGRGVHYNSELLYEVCMKIADFLYENSMTPGQLRTMLGVKNRSTIHRYLLGERVPNPETMLKIVKLTRYQVGLADFLDPSPPKCAKVVEDEHGVPRILLPWSPDYPRDDDDPLDVRSPGSPGPRGRPGFPGDPRAPDDDELSRPVRRAMRLLEGRAVFTRSGTFLLDGRVRDLKDIMRAANAALAARGEPPIPYPGVCPLHPDVYAPGVHTRVPRRSGVASGSSISEASASGSPPSGSCPSGGGGLSPSSGADPDENDEEGAR